VCKKAGVLKESEIFRLFQAYPKGKKLGKRVKKN